VLALALAGATVAATIHFRQQIELRHKQALAQQSETSNRLARVHEDEREIREKIARYQKLVSKGHIAPERRLDWVETLRHIKDTRKLAALDYEIAPQRLLDEKKPESGGYNFLTSAMKLDMPLVHENDLLGLISDLRTRVSAIISPKHCLIERATTPYPAAALRAQCDIDWITLQEVVPGDERPSAGGK
jgi:hypothetical protein